MKTFEQVRAVFGKRASRMTSDQLFYYANNLVTPEIENDYYDMYENDAAKTAEITIVAGQYAYALPDDYFDVLVPEGRTSPVTDSNRKDLRIAYNDSSRTANSQFGSRVYWITSGYINFPKKSIDDGDFTVGEVISLDYLKSIPEIAAEDEELPFGERLQGKFFPMYVHGIQFGYFRDAKKLTDRQLQLGAFNTAKTNAFS